MRLRIRALLSRFKKALPKPPEIKKGGGAPIDTSDESSPQIICATLRFWASSRPARDRTARCSLHWCRRGFSRLDPVVPGSAARSRVEVKPSALNRGGAPKGERAGNGARRTADGLRGRMKGTSPIREPHPPHRSAVTGRRPFDERALILRNVTRRETLSRDRRYIGDNSFGRNIPKPGAPSSHPPHDKTAALPRRYTP